MQLGHIGRRCAKAATYRVDFDLRQARDRSHLVLVQHKIVSKYRQGYRLNYHKHTTKFSIELTNRLWKKEDYLCHALFVPVLVTGPEARGELI